MPGTIGSDFYIEGTSTPSYNNIITSTKKEGKTSSQDRTFEREENAGKKKRLYIPYSYMASTAVYVCLLANLKISLWLPHS